ncbi:uncharacterized protein FOMMEDRAFT_162016 [Fomitiporia mediterranea MF3/22]|uniref:uncharacterized protein n=1 Tax=Fomitiporia mediterranea (strain MF3/22) TaxID=694068 RepID=UPI0004409BF3|nr:uncharacterized protein FOMMEDRAFT_162016 [Fomitiporia mediterranea MF3/22]EJC98257.1 hypothetical protein FOMMEDRAFT_162016 [Fomitiporia mediterranea MF3/22]
MQNVRFAEAPRLPTMWSPYESKKISNEFSVLHYYDFYWATLELKTQLARCRSMFRPLGSCAPVLASVSSTHAHLAQARKLFGLNALALFPKEKPLKERFRNFNHNSPQVYLEALPMELHLLSDGLNDLNSAFRSYSKFFSDDKLVTSLVFLAKDLEDEAECAKKYIATWKTSKSAPLRNLQIRFHLVLQHYTIRIRTIERLLAKFLREVTSQREHESRFLTMTTIATFFSGVTATMLQMTYQTNDRPIDTATNLLYLASLVFSITSAVSSLGTIAWHKSVVRNPESILPEWASAWLEKWPRTSLMLAGVCYAGATCFFVFSASQTRATQISVIVLIAFSVMTVLCSTLWLIVEEAKVFPILDDKGIPITDRSFSAVIMSSLMRTMRFVFCGARDDRINEDPYDIEANDRPEFRPGHPIIEGPLKPQEVQLGMDPIPAPVSSGPIPSGIYASTAPGNSPALHGATPNYYDPQTYSYRANFPGAQEFLGASGNHPPVTPSPSYLPNLPGMQEFLDGRRYGFS